MKIDLLKIKSSFPPPKGNKLGFDAYVSSMERLIKRIVPESIFELDRASHFIPYESCFQKLNENLPLIHWDLADEAPCTLSISVLCSAYYTHGTGRYFIEAVARSLLPGKQLPITVVRSLNFKFLIHPSESYFITETFVEIENERDLKIISSNLKRVAEEIRLSILGVQHARKLVLSKPLSLEEKHMILVENLSSLVNRSQSDLPHSIFDETHHLLLKAYAEEKPDKFPEHLVPFIEDHPQTFDPDIFDEIQNSISLFQENFTQERDIKHLNRLLSYLYLFRKIITHNILTRPQERHFSFKLLPTHLTRREKNIPILAILIGVNLIGEYETLKESDVIEAIQKFIPNSEPITDTLSNKELDRQRVRTLYIEVKKTNHSSFTHQEIKELKKKLPKEIKGCIKSSLLSFTSEPNEEEVMRNILTLSKHLKHPQDLPLVIINFQSETELRLSFTIIVVAIQKPEDPIHLSSTSTFTIESHVKKTAGILNKRYLKEAHVFEVHIEKKHLMCQGGSIKLANARQALISYLKENLGELRDFNGGMIVRQYMTLSELKSLVDEKEKHPLLENYFYSLTPTYMQSLTPPSLLHHHFTLITELLTKELGNEEYLLNFQFFDNYFLAIALGKEISLIDTLKEKAYAFTSDNIEIISAFIKAEDFQCLGFILSSDTPETYSEFKTLIENAAQEWKTLSCFPSNVN